MARLPRVRLGRAYTEIDRSREFLEVFGTEQGQRVLAQIMDFCNPPVNPTLADSPGKLAFREGQRWAGAQIMGAFVGRDKRPKLEKTEGNETDA